MTAQGTYSKPLYGWGSKAAARVTAILLFLGLLVSAPAVAPAREKEIKIHFHINMV